VYGGPSFRRFHSVVFGRETRTRWIRPGHCQGESASRIALPGEGPLAESNKPPWVPGGFNTTGNGRHNRID
jgi:hypothetical protein